MLLQASHFFLPIIPLHPVPHPFPPAFPHLSSYPWVIHVKFFGFSIFHTILSTTLKCQLKRRLSKMSISMMTLKITLLFQN